MDGLVVYHIRSRNSRLLDSCSILKTPQQRCLTVKQEEHGTLSIHDCIIVGGQARLYHCSSTVVSEREESPSNDLCRMIDPGVLAELALLR